MKLQISELAKLAGVSVRTLHYYDTIGLLKPSETDPATGYRFYDETSVEKLKEILYYRELDFALKDISKLMEEKEAVKKRKLLERRKLLQQKKKQLELLGILLERAGNAPLDTLLRHYIFEPLNMTNTSYEGTADLMGYAVDPSQRSHQVPISWNYNHNNTSWGLLSTAEDLKLWFDALLDKKLLSAKGYTKLFSLREDSCGLYQCRNPYAATCDRNGIHFELHYDFEKPAYRLNVWNKAPLPDNHDRLMYFTIPGCDNGLVRLEAWELDTDTTVKLTSLKIFDKEAKELYSFPCSNNNYLLYVENHGEKRQASDFIKDDSYYLLLDLTKILEKQFDPLATYFLEVRAECDSPKASQIGIKYLHHGEEQCMGYYIFCNEIQPYELFIEALGNVMEVI